MIEFRVFVTQHTTLKVLKQYSLRVYLRNLQEEICVMNLIHICTAWWLWIHMKLLVAFIIYMCVYMSIYMCVCVCVLRCLSYVRIT